MSVPLTIVIKINHQKHITHSYYMDVWIIFIIHCFYVLIFLTNKIQLSVICLLFLFALQTVVLMHMGDNVCSLALVKNYR